MKTTGYKRRSLELVNGSLMIHLYDCKRFIKWNFLYGVTFLTGRKGK